MFCEWEGELNGSYVHATYYLDYGDDGKLAVQVVEATFTSADGKVITVSDSDAVAEAIEQEQEDAK